MSRPRSRPPAARADRARVAGSGIMRRAAPGVRPTDPCRGNPWIRTCASRTSPSPIPRPSCRATAGASPCSTDGLRAARVGRRRRLRGPRVDVRAASRPAGAGRSRSSTARRALEIVTDRAAPRLRPRAVHARRAERPGPRQRQQLPQRLALRRARARPRRHDPHARRRRRPRPARARHRVARRASPRSTTPARSLFDDDGWVSPRDGGPDRPLRVRLRPRLRRRRCRPSTPSPGRQPVLPRWALGNWWSRYHRYSADSYLALLDRFDAEGLPFSVAVLDMDWHRVDSVPEQLRLGLDRLQLGARRCSPTRRASSPSCTAAACGSRSTSIRPTACARSRTPTRRWPRRSAATPTAGSRSRSTSPTRRSSTPTSTSCTTRSRTRASTSGGSTGSRARTRASPASTRCGCSTTSTSSTPAASGRRPLTFSRYAGPGQPPLPGRLLRRRASSPGRRCDFQPEFTATASNIGYGWWSHDIGGHIFGVRDDELATRWVQLGVFSPILRLHSSSNPFLVKEPWLYPARGARRDDARRCASATGSCPTCTR